MQTAEATDPMARLPIMWMRCAEVRVCLFVLQNIKATSPLYNETKHIVSFKAATSKSCKTEAQLYILPGSPEGIIFFVCLFV